MKKEKLRDKKAGNRGITILCRYLFFLGTVMLVILQSFLGNGVGESLYIVISIITIIIMVTILLVISYIVVYIANIKNINCNDLKEESKCKHFNAVCCVSLAIDSLKSAYRIRLDNNTAIKYGLYSEEQLIEKESNINIGEVWIVSYDLTAEALEHRQAKIREINLRKGIKYRLFYINDITQKYGELQDNIIKLDKRYNKKMKLYPYERPVSIFSFLFSLFGIIMFTDENGIVKESFFTLYSSNDKIKEPIYIKMSYCMEKKYNKILSSIKRTARNPREHKKQYFIKGENIKKIISFLK